MQNLPCYVKNKELLTVSAHIKRRHSIKILYFLPAHSGQFMLFLVRNYSIFGQIMSKNDHSVPNVRQLAF